MKPTYKIKADDQDITALIQTYFVSLSIKDSVGLESDTLTLVLADPEGVISWPKKGVQLKVWLGFDELDYKGSYIVDEIDYASPANQLTIVSRAADIKSMSAQRKSRHWGRISLGQIINVIAGEQGLIPAVSDGLAGIIMSDMWQMDETDLHFLSRIADRYQAIVQAKSGRLLLTRRGSTLTVSGKPMPVFDLERKDAGPYHYSERRSEEFDAVQATYKVSNRTHHVQLGTGSRVCNLPQVFVSQAEAQAAAVEKYRSLSAGASELKITLSYGQAEYIAESGVNLTGFIPRVDELDWVISSVTHNLQNGLTTQLGLKRPELFAQDTKVPTTSTASTVPTQGVQGLAQPVTQPVTTPVSVYMPPGNGVHAPDHQLSEDELVFANW